ncbi:cell division protein SepF [Micropruina sonneratiae]|uniref:cell division protein SepF n=1 Tax=Micropruina sonneratiae TaxID=2986940 RepID=UPI002226B7B9|nr:cell division protein SepF [Micropruina sp. KQZ13P-5]MCW3157148.1 cell division protein SepF [Micropruina sp. KQZ13P-5]
MADALKKAAVWLGLVSDNDYAQYESGAEDVTQEVPTDDRQRATSAQPAVPRATPATPVPATAAATVTELESRRPASPAPRTADISRIITVHPRTYNEARTIGENFRDGVPVIMNLSDMEDVDAKRLVDFAAGLIFGLHGSIERITSKVFLLSPHNVNVTAEDKERIAGGFYNQS